MRKLFFLITLITIYQLLFTFSIYAASPDPVKEKLEEQVSDLKDRIASRVAQLNLVEKRGIVGTVTDVTGTQITLSDLRADTRFVDVDELTKFNGFNSSFGFSDIKKDSTLSVIGLYNKQSRRILARSIEEISLTKMIHGFVATVDSENFAVNISTDSPSGEAGENEQISADVETITKTFSYDETEKDLVRSGFSKISEGQSIFVVGKENEEDNKRITAERIIIFPSIVKGPTLQLSPSVTPSTGSGKKLTPITQ